MTMEKGKYWMCFTWYPTAQGLTGLLTPPLPNSKEARSGFSEDDRELLCAASAKGVAAQGVQLSLLDQVGESFGLSQLRNHEEQHT